MQFAFIYSTFEVLECMSGICECCCLVSILRCIFAICCFSVRCYQLFAEVLLCGFYKFSRSSYFNHFHNLTLDSVIEHSMDSVRRSFMLYLASIFLRPANVHRTVYCFSLSFIYYIQFLHIATTTKKRFCSRSSPKKNRTLRKFHYLAHTNTHAIGYDILRYWLKSIHKIHWMNTRCFDYSNFYLFLCKWIKCFEPLFRQCNHFKAICIW